MIFLNKIDNLLLKNKNSIEVSFNLDIINKNNIKEFISDISVVLEWDLEIETVNIEKIVIKSNFNFNNFFKKFRKFLNKNYYGIDSSIDNMLVKDLIKIKNIIKQSFNSFEKTKNEIVKVKYLQLLLIKIFSAIKSHIWIDDIISIKNKINTLTNNNIKNRHINYINNFQKFITINDVILIIKYLKLLKYYVIDSSEFDDNNIKIIKEEYKFEAFITKYTYSNKVFTYNDIPNILLDFLRYNGFNLFIDNIEYCYESFPILKTKLYNAIDIYYFEYTKLDKLYYKTNDIKSILVMDISLLIDFIYIFLSIDIGFKLAKIEKITKEKQSLLNLLDVNNNQILIYEQIYNKTNDTKDRNVIANLIKKIKNNIDTINKLLDAIRNEEKDKEYFDNLYYIFCVFSNYKLNFGYNNKLFQDKIDKKLYLTKGEFLLLCSKFNFFQFITKRKLLILFNKINYKQINYTQFQDIIMNIVNNLMMTNNNFNFKMALEYFFHKCNINDIIKIKQIVKSLNNNIQLKDNNNILDNKQENINDNDNKVLDSYYNYKSLPNIKNYYNKNLYQKVKINKLKIYRNFY